MSSYILTIESSPYAEPRFSLGPAVQFLGVKGERLQIYFSSTLFSGLELGLGLGAGGGGGIKFGN